MRFLRLPGSTVRFGTIALAFVLLAPAVALAHQGLRSSEPADQARVEVVPDTLRLAFYEPLRMEFTEVEVVGPQGRLGLGGLRTVAGHPEVLLVPIEAGWHAGEIEVRWRTVGADGHPSSGSFSFRVPEGAEGLPAELEPAPPADEAIQDEGRPIDPRSPLYAGIRWMTFVSLIGMIGSVVFRGGVLPLLRRRLEVAAPFAVEAARKASGVGIAAALLLVVAGIARLWAQTAALHSPAVATSPTALAATLGLQPWGAGWWLQMGAALGGAVFLAIARRGIPAGWVGAGLAAAVAATTPALSGHAAATSGTAIALDTFHVVGAGGWIGGLALLLLAGIPAARGLDRIDRGAAVAALVKGFSPIALAFAALVVATGLGSAWIQLGELPELWGSRYGRTLLLKLALVAGVFGLGAYNNLKVRPKLGDEAGEVRIRTSGTLELLVALAALVVTAVLVASPPPR